MKKQKKPPRALLFLFLVLMMGAFILIRTLYFVQPEIVIQGNRFLTDREIQQVAGISSQMNILQLSPSMIKARLEQDNRIAKASVQREFFRKMVITVDEKQPLALVPYMNSFLEIDSNGQVLGLVENITNIKLPIITGVNLVNVQIGKTVSEPQLLTALQCVGAMQPGLLAQVSEVNASNPNNLKIYTLNALEVKVGQAEQLSEKMQLLGSILADIKDKANAVQYIDLSVLNNPIVKMYH